jgi:folate-binding protein YgfZ
MPAESSFVVFAFQGEHAVSALNGQATQALTGLDDAHAPLTAFCDPKGRMIGSGRMLWIDETLHFVTARSQAEDLMAHLKPYLALARAEAIESPLQCALNQSPTQQSPGSVTVTSDGYLVHEYGDTCWSIQSHAGPDDPEAHRDRLNAGLGFVQAGSARQLIPQQAHYQMLGGVSFTKGCYTGQEVIARLEHLGQAKKTLRIHSGTHHLDAGDLVQVDERECVVFDAITDNQVTTALILCPETLESEELSRVPFEITRQVAGERPVKR